MTRRSRAQKARIYFLRAEGFEQRAIGFCARIAPRWRLKWLYGVLLAGISMEPSRTSSAYVLCARLMQSWGSFKNCQGVREMCAVSLEINRKCLLLECLNADKEDTERFALSVWRDRINLSIVRRVQLVSNLWTMELTVWSTLRL